MELVERKEDEEKTKEQELTENQKTDLFNSIVRGKDAIETIHTSRGDFKIKFPRMKDLETIGRLVAFRLNGLSAQCFDANTYNLIQQIATLDVIVISGPAWFENAKKENKSGLSWGDIPDQSFIQEVYALAYNFRLEVQKHFKQNQDTENSTVATGSNTDSNSEPGLFDGLSGSAGTSR